MLAASKPHSFQSSSSNATRPARTSSHPPISYPLGSSRPASQSSVSVESSRSQRTSRQNLMQWLSRHSTQSSVSSTKGSRRNSEQKPIRSIELVSNARSGALGSGATVVKTPQDALRESQVRTTYDGKTSPEGSRSRHSGSSAASHRAGSSGGLSSQEYTSVRGSPPLPPVPLPEDNNLADSTLPTMEPTQSSVQPRAPTREIPPPPSSLRSSLKIKTPSEEIPEKVPPLPMNAAMPPRVPPFRAILMSDIPQDMSDRGNVIVTLETCTTSFKTTFETLTSRPSHLATFLVSLIQGSPRMSNASSVYSTDSSGSSSEYHGRSANSNAPVSMHVFLDRASSPYVHILNYLRLPLGSPDAPELLPRGVFAQPSSSMRLEALLELRDEATYLQLDSLRKLCVDEIRHRQSPRLHARGISASTIASNHSMNASVSSLHTLLERTEGHLHLEIRHSGDSDSKSLKEAPRCIPTPQSWRSQASDRSHGRKAHSPPAGWI